MVELDNRPIDPRTLARLSRRSEVTKEMRQLANAIRRDARQLAPKRTGTLRKNIAVERVYDSAAGTVHYLVGWGRKAWYGWLVEAGTEDTAPQPHLVPAAVKHGAVRPDGG